jgi:DHA1 family inner membrane transport protein
VYSLTLATFVNMTSALGLGPFLPVVAGELAVPVALLGQIPATMMLLAALLGLVLGPLADHVGYRRTMLVSLLAVVASALATGFAPNFALLLLAALVGALGRAAIGPVAQAIVTTQYPEAHARRWALSWVGIGAAGSVVLGLPLLTTIASFSHWRVAFFLLGGATLGMTTLLGRVLPGDPERPTLRPSVRRSLAAYAPLWHHRPTRWLLVANLLGCTGLYVIWTYVAVFLTERYTLGTREVGWVYLVAGGGALVGNWLAGGLLGARPRPMMIANRLLGGLALAVLLVLPVPLVVATALLGLSMFLYAPNTVLTALVLAAESPAGRATTLTVNFSTLSLGQGLGGALGGLVLVVGGWATMGLCAFALMAAAAGLVWQSRSGEVAAPAPVLL